MNREYRYFTRENGRWCFLFNIPIEILGGGETFSIGKTSTGEYVYCYSDACYNIFKYLEVSKFSFQHTHILSVEKTLQEIIRQDKLNNLV